MKNKLLLMSVCILFICPIAIADENSYFPEGMKWSSRYVEKDGSYCGVNSVCTIIGDTIIEGKKYSTLVYANFDERFVVPIRESDKKIYVHITNRDVLLYDFGAGVGDSIPNNYIHSFLGESGMPLIEVHGYAHIIKTDTIQLLNGHKAKRQFYDNSRSEDIEFIGSTEGILSHWGYPPTPTCYGAQFNFCCSMNGDPLYEYNPGDCERISTLPINSVPAASPSAYKIIRDGQLLIQHNDKTYTVQGIEIK